LESQGKKFITICHRCNKTATKAVCVCEKHSQPETTEEAEKLLGIEIDKEMKESRNQDW